MEFGLLDLDDLRECPFLDLYAVLFEVFSDDFVEFPYAFPEFGVEVVFNAIVGPRLLQNYLPGSFCAMADHLLPISSCMS